MKNFFFIIALLCVGQATICMDHSSSISARQAEFLSSVLQGDVAKVTSLITEEENAPSAYNRLLAARTDNGQRSPYHVAAFGYLYEGTLGCLEIFKVLRKTGHFIGANQTLVSDSISNKISESKDEGFKARGELLMLLLKGKSS